MVQVNKALRKAAQGDENANRELKSLLERHNRTELGIVKIIHKSKSTLTTVYSVAENRLVRLQEQVNVLHQKVYMIESHADAEFSQMEVCMSSTFEFYYFSSTSGIKNGRIE